MTVYSAGKIALLGTAPPNVALFPQAMLLSLPVFVAAIPPVLYSALSNKVLSKAGRHMHIVKG
jgi:hypothetical protein